MNYQLTIIIPVYNEQESLKRLFEALLEYLRFTPVKSKILFIDDGSTDDSPRIIIEFCDKNNHFEYAILCSNKGLSTALKVGIDLCKTHYLGYMDADLQTSPKDFMLYFSHLDGYNMVNGIRLDRKDKFIKKMSSKIANGFRRLMINDGIVDTCCPLKVIETSYAQKIPFFKGMHRFLPALIQLQGGKVKQVEVSHYPRITGTPKYHLFNRVFGPLLDTLAFMWMKRRWISYEIKKTDIEPRRKSETTHLEITQLNE